MLYLLAHLLKSCLTNQESDYTGNGIGEEDVGYRFGVGIVELFKFEQ